VGVPGKLSLNTRNLDELIVNSTDNPWRPELYAGIAEGATGEFERDWLLLHRGKV
jgi:hypothetical protein